MTSLATAIGGMNHWDWCPICRGGLDTGLECDQCGADLMPIYTAFKESLSGGNPGEPKACTPAEERGIVGATGAGQPPDGNPESTGDSADRRSPDDTTGPSSPDESHRHFERGCYVIMELMQAYERRVRSDCTTQEQIDKRPWECAEYIKAAEYLRKVWPPHEPSGWQPIETAPKGRNVLVAYQNKLGKWRMVRACYYEAGTLMTDDSVEEPYCDEDGYAHPGWYEECESQEYINRTDEEPVLWHPLPALPPTKEPTP